MDHNFFIFFSKISRGREGRACHVVVPHGLPLPFGQKKAENTEMNTRVFFFCSRVRRVLVWPWGCIEFWYGRGAVSSFGMAVGLYRVLVWPWGCIEFWYGRGYHFFLTNGHLAVHKTQLWI